MELRICFPMLFMLAFKLFLSRCLTLYYLDGGLLGHHNVKIKIKKILEVYQNPSTLVLIVKLLRQALAF
jgi:hypothetical protein